MYVEEGEGILTHSYVACGIDKYHTGMLNEGDIN